MPWYRAAYADGRPIGFVMISVGIKVDNPDYLGPYYLWRLLADRRSPGRGYGKAILDLSSSMYARARMAVSCSPRMSPGRIRQSPFTSSSASG
jgi:diamine N-acetyltransferase